MKAGKLFLLVAAIVQLLSCKEPFEPAVKNGHGAFLVVEGVISTSGPTTIRLSRTINVSGANDPMPVEGASVMVEGDDHTSFPLRYAGDGTYQAPQLNLATGQGYRLRIRTPEGKEFLSDYNTARANPDIDHVIWKRDDQGVGIYVNTHDPDNNTRYYRWEYVETWQTRSYAYSSVKFTPSWQGLTRPPEEAEQLYTCWKTTPSTNILISSSARLSEDVISDYPLVRIPNDDEKLAIRYSILVRQYALTREAFEYLQRMKKNSEQMGSIFDPQPSEARGNIRCLTDPDEPVIGYVTVSPVFERRIFIDRSDVPGWNYMFACVMDDVKNHKDSLEAVFGHGDNIAIEPIEQEGKVTRYIYSTAQCMDCRIFGSNIKPDFWY